MNKNNQITINMETQPTFESLLREFLTPIITSAVENALAHHLHQPQPPERQQPLPDLMNVKMIAEFLHLSVPTIYGLTHRREIPFYKRGQRLLFRRDELEKWIAGGRRMTVDEIKAEALNSLGRGRRKR